MQTRVRDYRLQLCVATAVAALRAPSSYFIEARNARRALSLPRKVKVPGRIHLSSVHVRSSSASTGWNAAAAIRAIVGTPGATRQRDFRMATGQLDRGYGMRAHPPFNADT
jgi:hypothetical protein